MDDIIILGPKKAGKTTYLMSLAEYFGTKNIQGITVKGNKDFEELKKDAKNRLYTKKSADSTPPQKPDKMPDYRFSIDIPGKLVEKTSRQEFYYIDVRIKDYSGEIFDALSEDSPFIFPTSTEEYSRDSEIDDRPDSVQDYLKSFSGTNKWLLLLDDWEPVVFDEKKRPIDDKYVDAMTTLLGTLGNVRQDFRLAVVLGKCERGELWTGRRDPEFDIFRKRLPQAYRCLRNRFSQRPDSLRFFTCSSFGVLDRTIPLPNRQNIGRDDYRRAVIRDLDKWQPYGLITPLVWLSTGKLWKHTHI